jgi:hypothetical protein
MAETMVNPPETPEAAHAALDAISDEVFKHIGTDAMFVWMGRFNVVRDYARQTWPDEFPPIAEDGQ